jgi:hypothetical protein
MSASNTRSSRSTILIKNVVFVNSTDALETLYLLVFRDSTRRYTSLDSTDVLASTTRSHRKKMPCAGGPDGHRGIVRLLPKETGQSRALAQIVTISRKTRSEKITKKMKKRKTKT